MRKTQSTMHSGLMLGLAVCLLGGFSQAAETVVYLRADITTVTMPDGAQIVMWGFAQDSAFEAGDGAVTVPGPRITVPPGNSLRIVLDNNLTAAATGLSMGCPVCLVIPGQTAVMTPVRFGPMPYPQYEGRIRSFTHETPPGNTTGVDYVWPALKPGTYLYHSGTHVQCHVQMGLYGAMTQDVAPGLAYPGVEYDQEVLLLYSEIDPAFHGAVATNNYGPGHEMSSTINYLPKYFLINGQPFAAGAAGNPALPGARVLLRFLNAGLESHVPTVLETYAAIYAEDGNLSPYPEEQYAILLPAGKTHDALLPRMQGRRIPIVDRMLDLTNAALPEGGMLTYIDYAAGSPPEAPVPVAPPDGATGLSLTPTLQASPFVDPDPFDTHASSQWVVDDNADFSSPVFDSSTDSANLTSIAIPAGLLQNGTTYYWHVLYTDNMGLSSPWSVTWQFTTNTLPAQPVAVAPVDGATGVSLAPTLEASAFSDADAGDTHASSQWVVDDSADFSSPVFDSGADTTNLTTVTLASGLLAYNTTYYWRVLHTDNNGGSSPWSAPVQFTTTASTPPAQPVAVAPADGATDVSLTPTLEASAFSDADAGDTHASSQWVVDDNADFSSPVFDSGADATNLTTVTLAGGVLAYSTTYYWRVLYTDNHGGTSPWSTAVQFTTLAAPPNTPPAQPVAVAPVDGATEVSLTPTLQASAFSDPDAGNTHATSQWVVDNDADFSSPVFDSGADATNLTAITLTSGLLATSTTYYWRVLYTDNNAGSSPWSAAVQFTTVAATTTPGSPINVTAVAGNAQATVSFDPPASDGGSPVTSYTATSDPGGITASGPSGPLTVTGLTNGTPYTFTVTATNVNGTGPASSPSNSVTPSAPVLEAIYRLNCGGTWYFDSADNLWEPDNAYRTSGYVGVTGIAIAGTADQTLYQSERWNAQWEPDLAYQLPLLPGNYVVRLHFAEIYSGISVENPRVFDVLVEGMLALDNLNILGEAGYATALVKEVNVAVFDTSLNIAFARVQENPKIAAIEVLLTTAEPAPQLTLSSSSVDFDGVTIGESENRSVTMSNTGTAPLIITAITLDGPNAVLFALDHGALPMTIQPGANSALSMTFSPVAAGEAMASVSIVSNDPGGTKTVSLEGTGELPGTTAVWRINAGGAAYTDPAGRVWQTDNGLYNTGFPFTTNQTIAGTTLQALYQTERYDPSFAPELAYTLAVAPGSYTVNLHFAEIWFTDPGQRVFDVLIEGVNVLNEFDIVQDVGAFTATVKSFNVTVTDAALNIQFNHVVENPKVSAIEVIQRP